MKENRRVQKITRTIKNKQNRKICLRKEQQKIKDLFRILKTFKDYLVNVSINIYLHL